jgi:DNA-binding NarL/FixJ family response regulator
MVRMLIADQHAFVRCGLRRAVVSAGTFKIVAEAATLAELYDVVESAQVDVLICELAILGGTSGEVLKAISRRNPRLAIVVFTMHTDVSLVVECLNSGAKAYVSKEAPLDELRWAIRQAAAGKQYVDSRLREQASDCVSDAAFYGHRALSPREAEVLQLMADGKRNLEIAEILAVSPKTVSTHRARILEKMRLKTNQQIIRYELQRRLRATTMPHLFTDRKVRENGVVTTCASV